MQFSTGALRIVGAMAAIGTLLAIPASRSMPDRYVSMAAKVAVSTAPDPLTPRQLQDRIAVMRSDLLGRGTLSEMIQTLDLYNSQRQRIPMEEIARQMRKDIDLWGLFYPDHKRMALWVKFTYPDRYKAQAVVSRLLTLMDEPGRPEKLEMMRPANLPESPIPQQRWPILVGGLVAGLGVGVILALFSQPERASRKTVELDLYRDTDAAGGHRRN